MTCPNCGNSGNPEDRFCAQCGQHLMGASPPPFPASPASAPVEGRVNDLGYLLIAALIIFNIFIWRVSSLFSLSFNAGLYTGMRAFSLLILAAEFAVALIFTKKPVYKILIGIIFGLVLINSLIDFIQVLNMRF